MSFGLGGVLALRLAACESKWIEVAEMAGRHGEIILSLEINLCHLSSANNLMAFEA